METYSTYLPSPLLVPYIRYYWILRASSASGFLSERIIPTGCISLVFHRSSTGISSSSGLIQPRSFVSGISAVYSDLYFSGEVDMIAAVFQPYGVKAFLGIPACEFKGLEVSVSDLDDSTWKELEERLNGGNSDISNIYEIENFLALRLRNFKDYEFNRIAAAVESAVWDSEATVKSLSQKACLGERQLGRIFSETVGTSPKEFIRIVRFQRALRLFSASSLTGMSQIAAEAGYFDQSHMIREFKKLSGYTPSEYISVCEPYSDLFSCSF